MAKLGSAIHGATQKPHIASSAQLAGTDITYFSRNQTTGGQSSSTTSLVSLLVAITPTMKAMITVVEIGSFMVHSDFYFSANRLSGAERIHRHFHILPENRAT